MRLAVGGPGGPRPPGGRVPGGRVPDSRVPGGPARPDLPAIDREVLRRWADRAVAVRSLARNADGPRWTCYSDPPSAAGLPGMQHVPGEVIRDMYQRLKAMQGFDVPRDKGVDCHGLPVEIAVERELGLRGRQDIEAYGPDRFSARCRESALRHAGAFAALAARLGCWEDEGRGRRTMDGSFIESVWSSLRRLFEAGLLHRSRQVTPYCPGCQTPLSVADLAHPDARHTAGGMGVLVRFRLTTLPDGVTPRLLGAGLLSWTARPWSLVCNAAIAVHPHQSYVLARLAGSDDQVVVAESRLPQLLGDEWHVAARISGAELAGATYQPVPGLAGAAGPRPVVPGYFVSADSGTGLAHLAPAFGADDLAAAEAHGLPEPDPIGQDGRFAAGLPLVGGVFFADTDPILIPALSDAGALVTARRHEQGWPLCWRCGTPLLFRALSAWYIRTTAIADRLRADRARIGAAAATGADPAAACLGGAAGLPDPEERLAGRAADLAGGAADWAVSRTRYWGTPLPLWECPAGHVTCVGSLAELSGLAGRDVTGLDPHRPRIDAVIITCPRCGAPGRRVPEVLDARYDAGWLPFARPRRLAGTADGGADPVDQLFVATGNQPGGWYAALMTIGALVPGGPAIRSVLQVGAVLDDGGRTMSRISGNLADPLPLLERYGADAIRWFCAAAAPHDTARAVPAAALEEIAATVLGPFWEAGECLLRAVPAGRVDDPGHPGSLAPPPSGRPLADRWLLSELQELVTAVTADLAEFRPAAAGARITGFLRALSGWYLPGARRRFESGPPSADGAAAAATLHTCLEVLTRLMAPMAPFLTDAVWTRLRAWGAAAGPGGPDSVHLASWPVAVPELVDGGLASQVALARRLAGLGRSARAAAGVGECQPLARAVVATTGAACLAGELAEQVAADLNVRSAEIVSRWHARELLPEPDGSGHPPGWSVAAEGRDLVALETALTPGLRSEGLARRAIAAIMNARIADEVAAGERISLRWLAGSAGLTDAMTEHAPMISASVLAAEYSRTGPGHAERASEPDAGGGSEHADTDLGLTFWIRPLGP